MHGSPQGSLVPADFSPTGLKIRKITMTPSAERRILSRGIKRASRFNATRQRRLFVCNSALRLVLMTMSVCRANRRCFVIQYQPSAHRIWFNWRIRSITAMRALSEEHYTLACVPKRAGPKICVVNTPLKWPETCTLHLNLGVAHL